MHRGLDDRDAHYTTIKAQSPTRKLNRGQLVTEVLKTRWNVQNDITRATTRLKTMLKTSAHSYSKVGFIAAHELYRAPAT